MKNITHFYSLSPKWQYRITKEISAALIDDKIIIIPETIGVGHTYFMEIVSGFSVLFRDYVVTDPIAINKLVSDEDFYILSYNHNEHKDSNYEMQDTLNFDLSISNNQEGNIYKCIANERKFGLSLFIDKKLMHGFIDEMPHSEFINNKLNKNKPYNDYIDSNSFILISSLKGKSIYDISFEYLLKGVSLKLLANFLGRSFDLVFVKEDVEY